MKKQAAITGLIVILSLLNISYALAYTVIYTDKLGRVVTVEAPVKRAIILITYDLIPALDIWDDVVGINRWAYSHDDLFKMIRPNVEKTIPSVGTGDNVNIEAILALSLIHISEPTRLGMISYAVFCLKKKIYVPLTVPIQTDISAKSL